MEAALSSASAGFSFGCFSSQLLWGGVLQGFFSSPIHTKQLRTKVRDAADAGNLSMAGLTRDACQLLGSCCSAWEVEDAVLEGSQCYFLPLEGVLKKPKMLRYFSAHAHCCRPGWVKEVEPTCIPMSVGTRG